MGIKFGDKLVTITDEQAVSCFHALKVTLDAEQSGNTATLNKLWVAMNSALVDICNHYADLFRVEHGIPDSVDWDFED